MGAACTKFKPRHPAHPFKKIVHFSQILEIGFLIALDVPYVSAPHRIAVRSAFQPYPGDKRFRYMFPAIHARSHESAIKKQCTAALYDQPVTVW